MEPVRTAEPVKPQAQQTTLRAEPSPRCRAADPIAFDWVTIPAGEFLMGSDKTKDKLAYDNETPQHTLHLPEYRIAPVPVTVAQFAAFVEATGFPTQASLDVREKADHPVTYVSWHDAVAFCHGPRCGCPRRRNGRRPRAAQMAASGRGATRSRPRALQLQHERGGHDAGGPLS